MSDQEDGRVRLDKWLWAARFFKTRALAAEAVEGGKVQVNGERPKRARPLQLGDQVRIRLGPYEHTVEVRDLSAHRGPAARAAELYEETAASGRSTACGDEDREGRAHMFSIMASANSDVLSSVAPGISRSKS